MTEKTILRQQIKNALLRLSSKEKAEAAVAIQQHIESLPLFEQAQTILLYHSLPSEVNTHDWLQTWSLTKDILLPVVVNDDTLVVKRYDETKLKEGRFGIIEPEGEDISDLSVIDLAIVPGIGFDPLRNRLGRGKGYYDRLLKKIDAPFIGVAYDCQIVEYLPSCPHDVPMSLVISQSKIY